MGNIEITAFSTGAVLFGGTFDTIKKAAAAAVSSNASLRNANLRGANLRNADLCNANLCNASLRDADLCNANLCNASLRDANLYGANLRGASLYDADFCNANLRNANLRGANLYGSIGINKYQTTDLYMLHDQVGKIRAYKLVNERREGPQYGGLKYTIGATVTSIEANTDETAQCGSGISLCTLPWAILHWRPGYRVLIVEHTAKDIAAIPVGSDGKYRVRRCKVIREKGLADLGLVEEDKK